MSNFQLRMQCTLDLWEFTSFYFAHQIASMFMLHKRVKFHHSYKKKIFYYENKSRCKILLFTLMVLLQYTGMSCQFCSLFWDHSAAQGGGLGGRLYHHKASMWTQQISVLTIFPTDKWENTKCVNSYKIITGIFFTSTVFVICFLLNKIWITNPY